MAKSLNSIYAALVVALSYALKECVNLIPESAPVAFYFLTFMLLSLVVMMLCMFGRNKLLMGYGLLNFVLIVFYFPLVLIQSDMSYMILWELPIFSMANIVYAYEIILITLGIWHGWVITLDWFSDVSNRVYNGVSFAARLAR